MKWRLAFLLLALAGFSQTLTGQTASRSSVWASDVSLAAKLDPPQKLEQFLIRLPKGYIPIRQPGPAGSVIDGWAGEPRADGTRGQVVILRFSPGPDEIVKQADMEPALLTLVEGFQKGKINWKQEAVEHGVINGIPFVRLRWSAVHSSLNRKMSGFSYLTIIGRVVIQLSSQDVEPFHVDALRLAKHRS
jgi:hypothetical protein